ncbi:uncharacterized protein LOC111048151 isoform X2 [Nilaparvata lugens]|uniref:uncharacterized protein LOC111048151 isoform X2 n=1 Tax=Nilaparvata lugens TaxID=108931 RepID=UPI00193C99C5|nr:uncharacterized protein LOC111048151 isoform X2 [Nilaparvata lugens]
MKRYYTSKAKSLEAAIQNVGLLADNTWLFDDFYNDEFKQKNLELWIDFKEAEDLVKNNQNTLPSLSSLADDKKPNCTSCDGKQDYSHQINNGINSNADESLAYTCQHFSENVDRIYESLTLLVPERSHSKMKFAQPTPSALPPCLSKQETECNHCASSKKWLSVLPWPSLLIKNFPSLPEVIPDEKSLYTEVKPRRRDESDLKRYPPPHYTIKTSDEFKLHMAVTSSRVKAIWDDTPSTGKTLADIFKLSHSPGTSVELDCEIPEFYPRSWQVLPNSSKPFPCNEQERACPQEAEYLEGCRSQAMSQPEGLSMETKYDYSFGIFDQQSIEPNNFMKMVEYSGWPVIDNGTLDEMNASVARLYPEREQLFYEMMSVVDTVYNFFEDGFVSQNSMNNNTLACYPTATHSDQSRDEENAFAKLEKEALEQYQDSDHQLMTVQQSDDSIARKFQDLEQEAMEQYNTSETLHEEAEEEEEEERREEEET